MKAQGTGGIVSRGSAAGHNGSAPAAVKSSVPVDPENKWWKPGTNQGTQLDGSKSFKVSRNIRIDVENPNPNQRPGQIHVENKATGEKFYYSVDDKKFYDQKTGGPLRPFYIKLAKDPKVARELQKAEKILGVE